MDGNAQTAQIGGRATSFLHFARILANAAHVNFFGWDVVGSARKCRQVGGAPDDVDSVADAQDFLPHGNVDIGGFDALDADDEQIVFGAQIEVDERFIAEWRRLVDFVGADREIRREQVDGGQFGERIERFGIVDLRAVFLFDELDFVVIEQKLTL